MRIPIVEHSWPGKNTISMTFKSSILFKKKIKNYLFNNNYSKNNSYLMVEIFSCFESFILAVIGMIFKIPS